MATDGDGLQSDTSAIANSGQIIGSSGSTESGTGESENRETKPERSNGDSARRNKRTEEKSESERVRKPRIKREIKTAVKNPVFLNDPAEAAKKLSDKLAALHDLADLALGTASIKLLHLEPTQAEEMGRAIIDVVKQYDVNADPKTMAWLNLILVMGAVYGSKYSQFAALNKLKKAVEQNGNTNA